MKHQWVEKFPGAVTVCDPQGIVLEMNEASQRLFSADGGAALIGQNLLDCHPAPARQKLLAMMQAQRPNMYTIEKHGIKKLIYQTPWYDEQGNYAGFVEIGVEIPFDMPHFVRG